MIHFIENFSYSELYIKTSKFPPFIHFYRCWFDGKKAKLAALAHTVFAFLSLPLSRCLSLIHLPVPALSYRRDINLSCRSMVEGSSLRGSLRGHPKKYLRTFAARWLILIDEKSLRQTDSAHCAKKRVRSATEICDLHRTPRSSYPPALPSVIVCAYFRNTKAAICPLPTLLILQRRLPRGSLAGSGSFSVGFPFGFVVCASFLENCRPNWNEMTLDRLPRSERVRKQAKNQQSKRFSVISHWNISRLSAVRKMPKLAYFLLIFVSIFFVLYKQ